LENLKPDQIQARGFDWPGPVEDWAVKMAPDGAIDLDATRSALERSLAFYKRELAEMREFRATTGAPWSEITDKRGEYNLRALKLEEAIGHVYTIIAIKEIEEEGRVLGRSEVGIMLGEYFVGPITGEIVSTLIDYVARVVADPSLLAEKVTSFRPNYEGRGFGQAWREQLAFDRAYPRSIDLAAWLAASTKGYPAPKPYCPDIYIGRWTQQEPRAASAYAWEFDAGGRFHAEEPLWSHIDGSRLDRWRVHRRGPEQKGDEIWLEDTLCRVGKTASVVDVTPSMLTLKEFLSDSAYHLVRV
jgi:hypothetical protein